MPQESGRDSMPKTLGIRNGEPKRPESLIEMQGVIPQVPEVSLCFAQDKNNSPQVRNSSSNVAGNVLESNDQKQQKEIFHRNQYESYNTWKAKNAHALHNITGSLERVEITSKRPSSSRKSAGIVRKQNGGKELHSSPKGIHSTYAINQVPVAVNPAQGNNPSGDFHPYQNGSVPQNQILTSNQGNCYPGENQVLGGFGSNSPTSQTRDNHLQYYARDVQKYAEAPQGLSQNHSFPSANTQNPYTNIKDTYNLNERQSTTSFPEHCIPNNCVSNHAQCHCRQPNMAPNPVNGNQLVYDAPTFTKESRSKMMQIIDPNLLSQWDPAFMNNQLSNLYRTINLQNEQISMLHQEIISQKVLISALHEEVKQIHVVVSQNVSNCHLSSANEKSTSHSSSCLQKNCGALTNDTRENVDRDQCRSKLSSGPVGKEPSTSSGTIDKRSIGVMTSSLETDVQLPVVSNDCAKTQRGNVDIPKDKKQYHKQHSCVTPSSNKKKRGNRKDEASKEEKRKLQSKPSPRSRKSRQEKPKTSSQSDDSFSLNEADVLRIGPEQGDVSPDVSIHVDMPDDSNYSSSSGTSDSSSTDCEDEGQESGSEGGSSDPQIGWTFYDRVVGQVNNLLKKTSTDTRQEHGQPLMKNPGNILYQCTGDYETENNWSKRVTFDGPPLEDSDNAMHMPRYHQYRTSQDYRGVNGGPERVPDFMMCDYATNAGPNLSLVNGSTNVSFATYRYYQRHQLLPPHPGMKMTDQMFQDTPQMKKKKSKSRKTEKTPPMLQKSYKRRGGPPSKILDTSALKQQPKLF